MYDATADPARVEDALQEHEVEPAAELMADLAKVRDLFEPQPLVHAQRGTIGGIDAGYLVLLRVFVPRMRDRSKEMSEVRSMLTGRIVDSYTNILTVKLFSRPWQEDAYVREAIEVSPGEKPGTAAMRAASGICVPRKRSG